ncbi:MAG: asparagine synthase (glutamine-hydrolyzing) [Myxococcota bacterium]
MGGLAGAVHFHGEAPDHGAIHRMSEALGHRGRDGAGKWAEGPASFAHRLRRVRATPSRQPVVTPRLVALLDGWVYDHEALARAAGHHGGCTDAEAVAHAWERWGPSALERIDGEFAIALWERDAQVLWLARDRLGVRPLYWAQQGARIAFASELPALTTLPWVSRAPDLDRLAEFLSFTVIHAPRTLVRDVSQVEPAAYVRVDASSVAARQYWRVPYAPPGTPRPRDAQIVRSLQAAVDAAVRRRVPRDVPTGLYLSGGLGSTAIAAAGRDHGLELPTFHVSVADDPHPEAAFAGRVARLLGLDHHETVVGTSDLAGAFQEVVTALGHPDGNPSALLQLALARAARKHVRIALSGDGGEELFGGRMLDSLSAVARVAGSLSKMPAPARRLLSRLGSRRVTAMTTADTSWVLDLGLGGRELFTTDERTKLLRDPTLTRPRVRQEVLAPLYEGLNTDPINMILHGYLRSLLCDGSLVRADRTAAIAGLDTRFPLLDRGVVERAASLPGSAKVRRVAGSLHTRWPLRALVSGVLPRGLANRPKRGLAAPLDRWLSGPGRLFFEERYQRLLRDPHGLWHKEPLADLRRRIGSDRGAGARLWSLFLLDAWLNAPAG